MPSKAEIYRRKCGEVNKGCPEGFYLSVSAKSPYGIRFGVSECGELEANNCAVFPATSALALRDWLTDTFDDGGER
jgi:hypothetical protein